MCREKFRHIPAACLIAYAVAAGAAHAVELRFVLDGLEAPDFTAKAVPALVSDKAFRLAIGELAILGKTWRNLNVSCGVFRLESDLIECRDGAVDAGAKMPLAFSYRPKSRDLDLTVQPRVKETWRLQASFAERSLKTELTVENGLLANLAALMPADWPKTNSGTFNGKFTLEGSGEQRVAGELSVRGVAFSDASGLHAGEKLDADVRVSAQATGAAWRWQAGLEWKGGEVFWQPLYLRAIGQTLRAEGTFDERRISVARANLNLPGVGELEAAVEWDRRAGRVQSADLRSKTLDAAALYER